MHRVAYARHQLSMGQLHSIHALTIDMHRRSQWLTRDVRYADKHPCYATEIPKQPTLQLIFWDPSLTCMQTRPYVIHL